MTIAAAGDANLISQLRAVGLSTYLPGLIAQDMGRWLLGYHRAVPSTPLDECERSSVVVANVQNSIKKVNNPRINVCMASTIQHSSRLLGPFGADFRHEGAQGAAKSLTNRNSV